jgi:hypothetical protein
MSWCSRARCRADPVLRRMCGWPAVVPARGVRGESARVRETLPTAAIVCEHKSAGHGPDEEILAGQRFAPERTHNPSVGGSSPPRPTSKSSLIATVLRWGAVAWAGVAASGPTSATVARVARAMRRLIETSSPSSNHDPEPGALRSQIRLAYPWLGHSVAPGSSRAVESVHRRQAPHRIPKIRRRSSHRLPHEVPVRAVT